VAADEVLEVHVEELGQHSWWKALLTTLGGTYGSTQLRFVARPPGPDAGGAGHLFGATFPAMRLSDLDDLTEPNAWLDEARERLEELDRQLVAQGWHRVGTTGRHWWSRTYGRVPGGPPAP
jgi:hypothetical protein